MSKDDFQRAINKITKQAVHERKQESALGKKRKKEAGRMAKVEPKMMPEREEPKMMAEQEEQENTAYTAVIIAKLEYEGDIVPSKEQLAQDLGHTIMNWADQKGLYGISHKESVPKLVSVDIDIK